MLTACLCDAGTWLLVMEVRFKGRLFSGGEGRKEMGGGEKGCDAGALPHERAHTFKNDIKAQADNRF